MSFKNFTRVAIPMALIVIAGGCSTGGLRSGKDFLAGAAIENRPVIDPTRSVSGFTDGLACMDKMLRLNQVGTTLITSKAIQDPTGQVPVAIKEMIISSLSQMSRSSHAFRFVDYEVSYTSQDTVQVLTQALMANGQMNIQAPTLYVSGAVSYMDKNIHVATRDIGIDSSDAGIGLAKDWMATQFGIELHLGDFFTRTLLPGIEAANEVALANKGVGLDAGAKISKTGVDFSISDDYSQGTGAALRALVDLSMIELIGKWAQVPYWQCVSMDQSHPEFQRELYQWYQGMDSPERLRFMQTGLRGSGYYTGEVDGRYSESLKQALARYQSDHDAVPTGNINFETYERLAKDYVRKDGEGRFISVGWGRDVDGRAAQMDTAPRDGKPAWGELPKPAEIEISLGQPSTDFKLGDTLQAQVLVSRSAYLYCFYQDASGAIAQVYPESDRTLQPALPDQPISIPSAGAGFTLDMTRTGSEAMLCLAAGADLRPLWPEALRATPSLTPLAEGSSLEELEAVSLQVLPGQVGVAKITWRVESHK